MIELHIRPLYQKICVDPVVNLLRHQRFCSPLFITFLALLTGIACFIALYFGAMYWAVATLIISGYLDTLDGSIARAQGAASPKGAVLDIVVDRIVEFLILLGLYFIAPETRALPIIWMMGASWVCVTSFLVVGVFTENKSHKGFHYSTGLMERFEAFLFFLLMILIPAWFMPLAWVYVALVLFTAAFRVYQFFQYEDKHHG
ncbi:MAG: CDP-alcohol phosphatidyltransferase family protein [Gammaproteobacteria bacterium]|nr:CDP-alcohol phosphatidyltransferase family protein [Gammaproteobacteria bacterium]